MKTAVHLEIVVAFLFALAGPVRSAVPPPVSADPLGRVATLPPTASPHWVWVNDFVFPHMPDGQAILVDGDSGRFLGMLSTGFGFSRLVLAKDGKIVFSPETYFSRGTRGTRTDVVTMYDPVHLAPIGEIFKRSSVVRAQHFWKLFNHPQMGSPSALQ